MSAPKVASASVVPGVSPRAELPIGSDNMALGRHLSSGHDGAVTATPPPVRTRRETKKLRTRHALIDAALELFASDGYDTTSVEAIAERAGVSPRTFFRYFPSKEDVLFFGEYDYTRSFTGVYLAQPPTTPEYQAIRDSFLVLCPALARIKQRIVRYEIAIGTSTVLRGRERQHDAENRSVIAAALATRRDLPAPDHECELLAAVAQLALRSGLQWWLASSVNDPRPFVESAFDTLGKLTRAQP